ncbi:hypothetical protein M1328_00515, partial [Patescibacteria group bacterium]|nr:hypothetical protein [Patescibacteria group bacterium]
MKKKIYSKLDNVGVSFMKPWKDIKKGLMNQTPIKKLFFYVFAGFIFVAIISGFIISRRGFIYETKKKPNPLTFQRQLIGPYAYTGDVNGVMTASFSVDKNVGSIEVSRDNSRLTFNLPITNATLTGEKGSLLQPEDVSFKSQDNIIEAKYNLIPDGLKEEIILNKIPSENRLPIKLKTTNLKLKITADGTPVFYAPSSVIPAKAGIQSQDQYMFNFERPFVKDGAGNVSYGVWYVFQGSDNSFQTKSGNSTRQTLLGESMTPVGWPNGLPTGDQTMMIEIDSSWLHDPKRVLPIIIDPTIVHNTSSVFDTGNLNRIADTGSGSSPNLQSYYHELPADQN